MKKTYEKPLVELIGFEADEDLLLEDKGEPSASLGGGGVIEGWD